MIGIINLKARSDFYGIQSRKCRYKWTVTISIKNKNPSNKSKVKSNLKNLELAGVTFDESKMEFTAKISPTKPYMLYQLNKDNLKGLRMNLLKIYDEARKGKKKNNDFGAPDFIKDLEMLVQRALMNALGLANGCTCWYCWTPAK